MPQACPASVMRTTSNNKRPTALPVRQNLLVSSCHMPLAHCLTLSFPQKPSPLIC